MSSLETPAESSAVEEGSDASPRRQDLARLVLRMQDGDGRALEDFIRETEGPAWRLAFSLLRDRHRAEDCLQDVYFTVYRSIHQVRDPYAAQTWLLRIVTHRCRRLLRARPADSLEELAESGIEPEAPDSTQATQDSLEVQQTLASLGAQDREVLTLREVMQLSYEEIAQGLQIPLGTVRSRLAKARQRFIQALTGRGGEGPPGQRGGSRAARLPLLLAWLALFPALLAAWRWRPALTTAPVAG